MAFFRLFHTILEKCQPNWDDFFTIGYNLIRFFGNQLKALWNFDQGWKLCNLKTIQLTTTLYDVLKKFSVFCMTNYINKSTNVTKFQILHLYYSAEIRKKKETKIVCIFKYKYLCITVFYTQANKNYVFFNLDNS